MHRRDGYSTIWSAFNHMAPLSNLRASRFSDPSSPPNLVTQQLGTPRRFCKKGFPRRFPNIAGLPTRLRRSHYEVHPLSHDSAWVRWLAATQSNSTRAVDIAVGPCVRSRSPWTPVPGRKTKRLCTQACTRSRVKHETTGNLSDWPCSNSGRPHPDLALSFSRPAATRHTSASWTGADCWGGGRARGEETTGVL